MERIAMHGREQADGAQAFVERALRISDGIFASGIEHEEADEAIGVERDGLGHCVGITRQARDQRGFVDLVRVELRDPPHAKLLDRFRMIPPERSNRLFVRAQPGEETRRKEMDMTVVNHRDVEVLGPGVLRSWPSSPQALYDTAEFYSSTRITRSRRR